MTPDERIIYIFLSSPGDVSDERGMVRAVVDDLNRDPWLKGQE